MKAFARTVSVVLAVIMTAILVSSIIHASEISGALCLLAAIGFLMLPICAVALLSKGKPRAWLDRNFTNVAWIASAVYFLSAIAVSVFMRYSPIWDMNAVYSGAINWGVGEGITSVSNITFDATTYFYYFPNNLGAAGVLAIWFKICSLFGITDFLMCGFVLCAGMCALSFAGTALTARELGGVRAGIGAMVIFFMTVPMIFSAHMFYTDLLSMPFGVLGVYLLLRSERAKSSYGEIVFMLISALLIAIGITVKATVGVVIIVCIGVLLIKKHWRRFCGYSVFAIAAAVAAMLILNLAVYPSQLDKQKANQMNTPTLHWVMMGFSQSSTYPGVYSSTDYEFTRSFDDPDERVEAIKEEISNRLEKLGFGGTVKHFSKKLGYMFGDGTASIGDFMPKPAEGDSAFGVKSSLYNFLNKSGESYSTYRFLSDSVRLMTLLLATCFVIIAAIKGDDVKTLIPAACVAALAIFLCVWESNARYVTNAIPFMICSAGLCVEKISALLKRLFARLPMRK